MTKTIKTMLLLFLAACLLPLAALSQEPEQVHLAQLREQAQAGWEGSYQVKGRTITVKVEAIIPKAHQVPILVLGAMGEQPKTPEGSGWSTDPMRKDDPLGFVFTYNNTGDAKSEPAGYVNIDGEKHSAKPYRMDYGGFESEGRYLPGNDLTLLEISELALASFQKAGVSPENIELPLPRDILTHAYYNQDKSGFIAPGWGALRFKQKLHGIPVTTPLYQAFAMDNHIAFNQPPTPSGPTTDFTMVIRSKDLFWIGGTPLKELEVLAQDVPLAGFQQVIASLEKEILSGRLQKVFDLEFGYALFDAPDYDAKVSPWQKRLRELRVYAVPVWRVNCLYTVDGEPVAPHHEEPGEKYPDLRNSTSFQSLAVLAQTGELLNPLNIQPDRAHFPGFVPWKDGQ